MKLVTRQYVSMCLLGTEQSGLVSSHVTTVKILNVGAKEQCQTINLSMEKDL